MSTKRRTILGIPAETFRRLALADCTQCGKPASENHCAENHPQRDQSVLCDACIQAENARIDAENAAARAAAPKCEACAKRPSTCVMMPDTEDATELCGTCRNRVNRTIRVPMLFGAPTATRAQILAAARS